MSHISTAEVAKLAGYTIRHIQRMVSEGQIPGAKRTAGGHWKIKDSPELRRLCGQLRRLRERHGQWVENDRADRLTETACAVSDSCDVGFDEALFLTLRGRVRRNARTFERALLELLEEPDCPVSESERKRFRRIGRLLEQAANRAD